MWLAVGRERWQHTCVLVALISSAASMGKSSVDPDDINPFIRDVLKEEEKEQSKRMARSIRETRAILDSVKAGKDLSAKVWSKVLGGDDASGAKGG
jgi:hypothetical protein